MKLSVEINYDDAHKILKFLLRSNALHIESDPDDRRKIVLNDGDSGFVARYDIKRLVEADLWGMTEEEESKLPELAKHFDGIATMIRKKAKAFKAKRAARHASR